MTRDDLLQERLMASRDDVRDKLLPLLEKLSARRIPAGSEQEHLVRDIESAVSNAIHYANTIMAKYGGPQ